MSCCGGDSVSVTQSDKDMDKMLAEDAAKDKLNFKVLLLGTGESGKSTVVKQLKLIYRMKADRSEQELYATNIHKNCVQCMQVFINAANVFGFKFKGDLAEAAELVTNFNFPDGTTRMTPEVGDAIAALWESKPIRKAYERRSEFWFLDASQYYFDNVERLCAEDYVPTEEDCIMTRVKTTGVIVTDLPEDGDISFKVVDVGGQRNERKKWIHCFDNVNALLYVVNLAGYDQVMFEDVSQNRMLESLSLFKETVNNPAFENATVFILFNKKDLFEQMIKTTPISKCFPEYEGNNEFAQSAEYIQEQYCNCTNRPVQCLFTAARVKKDVKYCWDDVKTAILDANKETIKEAQSVLKKK